MEEIKNGFEGVDFIYELSAELDITYAQAKAVYTSSIDRCLVIYTDESWEVAPEACFSNILQCGQPMSDFDIKDLISCYGQRL